jgi:hypothetical protein
MAFTSGTATNHLDFVGKLRDFLKGTPGWVQLAGPTTGTPAESDEIVLKGPGSSGTDEIIVALTFAVNAGTDVYNVALWGLVTYNPSQTVAAQVNSSGARYLHLWNAATPYWFVANGRRFVVVAKVSTVYQSGYAGFLLPYHLPTTWAYPMFVGGCSNDATRRWSSVSGNHGAFFDPGEGAARLCFPDTAWRNVTNTYDIGSESYRQANVVSPWHVFFYSGYREAIDGDYVIEPGVVSVTDPFSAVMGAFEGVFFIPGFGNSSESIKTIGGVDYLVVQNVYRTTNGEYACIRLD